MTLRFGPPRMLPLLLTLLAMAFIARPASAHIGASNDTAFYNAVKRFDLPVQSVWTSFSHSGLSAASFSKNVGNFSLPGPGPTSPDFSSTGGPIEFGFFSFFSLNTPIELLLQTAPSPNPSDSKMYWTDSNNSGHAIAKVQRANLDGTAVELLVTPPSLNPRFIALDGGGGKMYWADIGVIRRANLDGSGETVLITGLPCPMGVALDTAAGRIYWTDCSANKIQSADLNGSNVSDVLTGLSAPRGIALDLVAGKIYWTETGGQRIRRANLDGTSIQNLVTGEIFPQGIALDVAGGKMYWGNDGKVKRANLDGTSITTLVNIVVGGLTGNPLGIALDIGGGKMYWTETTGKRIQRANLDGTAVQDLITTGLDTPWGIALLLPPNRPPVANAGSNQTVSATNGCQATVTLDGTASSDPDGDPLTYTWKGSFGTATGSKPTVPLSVGTNNITLTVNDGRGGTASASVAVTVRDTTPPVTVATWPAPNTYGWNNADVIVSLSATDNCSGVKEIDYSLSGAQTGGAALPGGSASVTISAEGTTMLTYFAKDNAGNQEAQRSLTVKIDKTPPTITASRLPLANSNGWNNADVTVSFSCSDSLSGISNCAASQTVSGEGAGQSRTGTATDIAGNTASATIDSINIDKTPPVVTFGAATPSANPYGWNNTNVSLPFTTSDNLSGVASANPAVSPLVLSTEGAAVSGTVTVTDVAGNTAIVASPTVKIDKTPPSAPAFAITPVPNGAGWNNSLPVTVIFSGTDTGSGIAGCSVPPSITVETAGTIVSGTCTDLAGNTGPSTFVTVKVDVNSPDATNVVATPTAIGSTGTLTATIADPANPNVSSGVSSADYSIDGGSFVAMSPAAGSSFGNPSVNVSATLPSFNLPGVHTVCVRGTDAAGNAGPVSCAYYAVYDANGGYVTGGGWINSPAGAYTSNANLSGKANFGFVSNYQKGANVPTGQTEFQFNVANFNFHSTSYEWLVIAGAKAQYKGGGTVNGVGNYGFILTAIDGEINGGGGVDKFRIKIWDINNNGTIVYDNQLGASDSDTPTTVLGGGSIVIHN